MKSKFKIVSYFIPFFFFVFLTLFIICLIEIETAFTSIFGGLFVCFMALIVIVFTFLEIKNNIFKFEINSNSIVINTYFGVNKAILIENKVIIGFKTISFFSRDGKHEYLSLLIKDMKPLKISNQYHKNYNELSSEIKKKYKELESKESNILTELKDLL